MLSLFLFYFNLPNWPMHSSRSFTSFSRSTMSKTATTCSALTIPPSSWSGSFYLFIYLFNKERKTDTGPSNLRAGSSHGTSACGCRPTRSLWALSLQFPPTFGFMTSNTLLVSFRVCSLQNLHLATKKWLRSTICACTKSFVQSDWRPS